MNSWSSKTKRKCGLAFMFTTKLDHYKSTYATKGPNSWRSNARALTSSWKIIPCFKDTTILRGSASYGSSLTLSINYIFYN